MKKTLLVALIAATALVPPVLAQDRGNREARQQARQEVRQQRQQVRQQQTPQQRQEFRQQRQAERQQRPQAAVPGTPQATRQARQARPTWNGAQTAPRQQFRADRRDDRQDFRQERREDRTQLRNGQVTRPQFRADRRDDRQDFRQERREDRSRFNRGNAGWNNDRNRGNWNGNSRYNNGNDRGRWNNGWRNDRRYDWRGYRSTNRSLYRLPRYYAPSGWGYGYRRFSIGYTLSSMLYSSQYWINDPFHYRLPEVDGPYRWVRYYNDAILVDIYSGEVVDTIYDIFW